MKVRKKPYDEFIKVKDQETGYMLTNTNACLDKKEMECLTHKKSRQLQFLKIYKNSIFNVTKACQVMNMSRTTFYEWRKEPKFKQQLSICEDELRDFIMSKLLELVEEKNMPAVIFASKALCGLSETSTQNLVVTDNRQFTQEETDRIVKAGLESEMARRKWGPVLKKLGTESQN